MTKDIASTLLDQNFELLVVKLTRIDAVIGELADVREVEIEVCE